MKKDCRLSFVKHIGKPKPIDSVKDIWVTGPEDKPLRLIYENLIVQVSQFPYLRNLAGRYMVDRTSISIQGDGKKYYSQN